MSAKKLFSLWLCRALLLGILVILSAATSFAWLASLRTSDQPAAFYGGSTDSLKMEIGVTPNGGTETARTFTTLTGATEDGLLLGFSDLSKGTDNYYHIALSDIQFGAIDNFLVLNPENVVYLRLTIPAEIGTNVRFKLYYNSNAAGYHFNIYKNHYDEDEVVTGQQNILDDAADNGAQAAMDGAASVETSGRCFLQYQYCLTSFYVADRAMVDENGEEVLDFGTEVFNFSDYSGEEDSEIALNYSGTYNTVEDRECYYLYLKLTPNLTAFGHAAEFITKYMPCYLTFDIGAQFEVLK